MFRPPSRARPNRALRAIQGVRSAKVLIDIHAPPAGAGSGRGRDPDSGNQARHRGRQRKRRRGQIDSRGESRGGTRKNRGAGRPVRLRHLRAEHLAHVRHAGTADGDGREPNHADRAIQLETDVDGIPARRHLAGDFARADGDALHAAISAAGRMGRARLSRARSAARAPATSS